MPGDTPPPEPDDASLLRALLESTGDSVKVLDREARLTRVNAAGLAAMGAAAFEDVCGQDWLAMWPAESRGEAEASFAEAVAGRAGRFTGRWPDPVSGAADRYWDVVNTPVPGGPGGVTHVLSVSRDVTADRRLAEESERGRRAAEDADRAKTNFLANISHEIRSPLAAIIGTADLLGFDDPAQAEALRTIRRNGRLLLGMVSDVIDLSRIEAGQVRTEAVPFSPAAVAEEVASVMGVRAEEAGLRLEVEYPGPLPERVVGDPVRTRQVVSNLVDNAVKFTDAGEVRLRVSYDGRGGGGLLRYEIVDTGMGMTAEEVSRAFDAFAQADASVTRRFGGSGLGLAICRQLCALLGGAIEVDSEPGRGSTFLFVLPAVAPDGGLRLSDPRPSAPKGADRPRLAMRVLVVDDRPDMRFLGRMLIEGAGGEVVTASGGAEAVETVAARGDIDAVLMDVQMPDVDGLTATRRIRAAGHGVPIIALTANALSGDRDACLAAGCTDYLSKPVDFAELAACLRKYAPRGG